MPPGHLLKCRETNLEKINIHGDFREESHLFHFPFLLEIRDSFGKKYKGTGNLSCAGQVSAHEGRGAKIFIISSSFKIKGVRRKHVMFVQKANETNSHNCVSVWSTVDCWKRDRGPRTAAWKRAAVSGSCHGKEV